MKTKTILIAAVMFFALSVAAFAQATFQVGSIPTTTVSSCGLTEPAGDITFTTVVGSSPVVTGTITINYGVAVNVAPVTTGLPAQITYNSGASSLAAGRVVFNVFPGATLPFTFTVTGVRVAVAGTSLTSLSASISSTGNALVAGQTNVVVISAITPGIASISATPSVSINAVTGGSGTSNITVTEGFLDAFVLNSMVRLTFSAVPAGITLTFPTTIGANWTLANADGVTPATYASLTSLTTPGSIYYKVTTATNATAIETLVVPILVTATTPTGSPITGSSVTVTANQAPVGGTAVPRYAGLAACEVGTGTVMTLVSANTTLLIPYVVKGGGYNTGIEIANTTKDPGLAGMGFAGALPQPGTIKFYFYSQTAGAASPLATYTTAAGSPGAGLGTDGTLAAGKIYTVMLDQLLTAAGITGDFSGYIFAVANFTNGHGQYFISDFEYFTNGALMLVVTSRTAPEAFGQ